MGDNLKRFRNSEEVSHQGWKYKKVDGVLKASKDGVNWSRPNKNAYDAINSQVFKNGLGKYTESKTSNSSDIKPDFSNISSTPDVDRISAQHSVAGNKGSGIRIPENKTLEDESTLPKTSKFSSLKKGLSSPETAYNLSRAKDVATDAALVASQYAIGKKTMNQLKDVKIPEAQQQSYIQGQRVNLDTDRGVNNTALATNLAIGKRSMSDANVAAAMRGTATSNYTQQGATINQTERNANVELGQQANMINSEIQRNNQANTQNKNMLEMQKQNELIKGNQLVNMEALHGVQGVIAGEGARQKDRNQLAIDSATLGSPYYKRLSNTMSGTTGYAMKKSIDPNDNFEGQPLTIRKNGGKIAKSKISTKLSNIYK